MKSLTNYISEKLIINKDYKSVNDNIGFFDKFRADNDELRWERFFDEYDSVEDIRSLNRSTPAKYLINISLDFNEIHKKNNKKIFFGYSSVNRSEKAVRYYNDMMKYVLEHEKEMEFVYNKDYNENYVIKEFMLPDRMLLLMGPKQITPTSLFGTILFIHL